VWLFPRVKLFSGFPLFYCHFSFFFLLFFSFSPPLSDFKSRFFWRIGKPPADDAHRDLNMPPVVPKAFPQWADTMNSWGETILRQYKTRHFMNRVVFSRLLAFLSSLARTVMTTP
jgi:hypothetical protein